MSAKRRMPDSPKRIGDSADRGRSESKEYLAGMLREARYETGSFDTSAPEEDGEDVMPSRAQRAGSQPG
jgi:hypothetical protein